MTVLLHVYSPTARVASQGWTWIALAQLEGYPHLEIEHVPCWDELGYAEALAERWDEPVNWLVVEHDIVPTPAAVAELLGCEEPVCAATYPLYDKRGGIAGNCTSGLGCTKVTAAARRAYPGRPAVPMTGWQHLGGEMHRRLGPYHVHDLTLDHHHWWP